MKLTSPDTSSDRNTTSHTPNMSATENKLTEIAQRVPREFPYVIEELSSKLKTLESEICKDSVIVEAEYAQTEENQAIPGLKWCAFCSRENSTEVVFKPDGLTSRLFAYVFGCSLCSAPQSVCSFCRRNLYT